AEAIRWLTAQMEQQHRLTVYVQATDDVPVPDEDVRVLLFQIVRELLFNVVKHAGVSEAFIALSRADHHIHIEVTDQGSGFDVAAVLGDAVQSHGLLHTRHRLELIGGNMRVESKIGGGTRIILNCPLSHQPQPENE
ncbi:MAG: hypothetical protein KF893_23800, partial [Caldilineaceae bacterium]|nr:hypothetical protein [Caldilineaceae bacterium]